MSKNKRNAIFAIVLCALITSCAPSLKNIKEDSDIVKHMPEHFPELNGGPALPPDFDEKTEPTQEGNVEATKPTDKVSQPTQGSTPESHWKKFFEDATLTELISLALKNNQELNIMNQEIIRVNSEVMERQGEYIPKLGLAAEGGVEKRGKYTSQAVSDATDEYEPGKPVPEKLPIYSLGLKMSWEVDIWKKLRNATKAAMLRYMASIDGRNFMVTKLVSEIASTYYELLSLDKQLELVKTNVEIQQQALQLVRLQMQAARVTSLAVRRFEAEVLKNRSRQFELAQKIVQTENKLNYLVGRMPQPIVRNSANFIELVPKDVQSGVPSALLANRPDVKRAERMLEAAKLEVKVARARFYPSLSIEAGAGYESFNSKHLFESPDSVFYNAIGNLTAPLLNRMAIKADYLSANANQVQAVYDYEKVVINAYTEVVNQLSMIDNMQKTFILKAKQAEVLNYAVEISTTLFKAARADYVEVLMTRRDSLDAQMELIEIKKEQLTSYVDLYRALGGGWRDETVTP